MNYVKRYVNVKALQYNTAADAPAILALAGHWASDGIRGLVVTTPQGGKRMNPGDWLVQETPSRNFVSPASDFKAEFSPV